MREGPARPERRRDRADSVKPPFLARWAADPGPNMPREKAPHPCRTKAPGRRRCPGVHACRKPPCNFGPRFGNERSHSERGPPSPSQLAERECDNTSNQDQKDRDGQVGLLLELLEAFADPCRSSEKNCAHEQKNRDRGGDE